MKTRDFKHLSLCISTCLLFACIGSLNAQGQSNGNIQQLGHKGLDLNVETGPDFSFSKGSGVSISTNVEVGKKFNKNFFFGVGSGVNFSTKGGDPAIPVFGSLRMFFPMSNSNLTPTLLVRGGYSFCDMADMAIIQVMPGFQMPISPSIDFNCGLGYLGSFGNGGSLHGLGVRAGIGFHKATGKARIKRPVRNSGLQYEIGATGRNPWDGDFPLYGMDIVASYKWDQNISFGVGYNIGGISGTQEAVTHTLFVRGKYRLNNNPVSPMANVDLGYRSYSWTTGMDEQFNKTACFITPSIGLSCRVEPNSYIDFKLGYQLSSKEVDESKSQKYDKYSDASNGITIGITFVHTLKFFAK